MCTNTKYEIRKENKRLIDEYPFLCLYQPDEFEYNNGELYDYTYLDMIPKGWKKRFGIKMCEEIKQQLIKEKGLDEYNVLEAKQKYGSLRWYAINSSKEIDDIIKKYTELSSHTCVDCGKDAPMLNMEVMYEPMCKECFENRTWHKWFPDEKYEDFVLKDKGA